MGCGLGSRTATVARLNKNEAYCEGECATHMPVAPRGASNRTFLLQRILATLLLHPPTQASQTTHCGCGTHRTCTAVGTGGEQMGSAF